MLLDTQRIALAAEFLQTLMKRISTKPGVLLSGPNGCGKSAVGLLSALAAYAQSLPIVYIPNARTWINFAETEPGHKFLLQRFLTQNAGMCKVQRL